MVSLRGRSEDAGVDDVRQAGKQPQGEAAGSPAPQPRECRAHRQGNGGSYEGKELGNEVGGIQKAASKVGSQQVGSQGTRY